MRRAVIFIYSFAVSMVHVSISCCGEYNPHQSNETRLFLAPTGRSLKMGHGYVVDYLFFFPTGTVGVTDHFSFGAGAMLVPGYENNTLFLTPKIGFVQGEHVNIATGLLYLNIGDVDDLGLAYTVVTLGGSQNAFTFGMGYGLHGGEWADTPTMLAGWEKRLSRHAKLISENWFFPDPEFALFSLGIRFMGGKRAAIEFFLLTTDAALSEGRIPILPFVDFAVNW